VEIVESSELDSYHSTIRAFTVARTKGEDDTTISNGSVSGSLQVSTIGNKSTIRILPREPLYGRETEDGGIDSIHSGEAELSVATKDSIEYRDIIDSAFSPR
jgi:hypothetical protein